MAEIKKIVLVPNTTKTQPVGQKEEGKKSIGRKVVDFLTSSEQAFGTTLGTAASTVSPQLRKNRETAINQAREQVDSIMAKAAKEKDRNKRIEMIKLAQKRAIDISGVDIFKNPEYQKTAKQIVGEAVGVGLDALTAGTYSKAAKAVTTAAKEGTKATVKTLAKQSLKQGAIGTVGGGAMAAQEGGDIKSGAVTGAAVGAAIPVAGALGKKLLNKIPEDMYNKIFNPLKRDLDKTTRLVDNKTLAQRLASENIWGTHSKMIKQLTRKEEKVANELIGELSKSSKKISGKDLIAKLDDVLDDKYRPLSVIEKEEVKDVIAFIKKSYSKKEFSPLELLQEKRAIGRNLGAKPFSTDSGVLRKLNNEQIVDRKLYTAMQEALENASDDPSKIKGLNKKLSTYIDGLNLLNEAAKRPTKLTSTLTRMTGAGLGTAIGSIAGPVGAAVGAAVGQEALETGRKVVSSTLSRSMRAQIAMKLDKAFTKIGAKLTPELRRAINLHLSKSAASNSVKDTKKK